MTIPSQDLKICTRCGGDPQPISEFYWKRGTGKYKNRRYRASECRTCTKKATGKYSKLPSVKAINNASKREKIKRVRAECFAAYGGAKCACCGETEEMFLSLDHPNNDGAEFRRQINGKRNAAGYTTYSWLKKRGWPSGYQVLCMNCNHGKRMNAGICPHQVRRND